jgi:hypothetical protein
MATKNYSYIGRGLIYAGEVGKALLPVGNCSTLTFAASETKISQPDYTTEGGGSANSVSWIDEVTGAMTLLDISPKHLSLAYRGTTREVAGGANVTDERHTAFPGALVAFNDTPDISTTSAIDVTLDPDGTPAALTEGTDYEVTRAGVVFLDDSANITDAVDGHEVGIDYPKAESVVMEALVSSGKEYRFVFDGLNQAQSGKAVTITAHRIKFSPTAGTSFIGDEFAELPLEFTALSDSSISGADISKFFKVAIEQ